MNEAMTVTTAGGDAAMTNAQHTAWLLRDCAPEWAAAALICDENGDTKGARRGLRVCRLAMLVADGLDMGGVAPERANMGPDWCAEARMVARSLYGAAEQWAVSALAFLDNDDAKHALQYLKTAVLALQIVGALEGRAIEGREGR